MPLDPRLGAVWTTFERCKRRIRVPSFERRKRSDQPQQPQGYRVAGLALHLELKLSVLALSQRLVTPRTPRPSGTRLGVQPLQLPEIPIHYKWGPQ